MLLVKFVYVYTNIHARSAVKFEQLNRFFNKPVQADNCSSDKIEKNEMGGACSAYGGEKSCTQSFGGET